MKSKFVRSPSSVRRLSSVVRPSVETKLKFLRIFKNMGPYGSQHIAKRYSFYKSQAKVFKPFLNVLPNGPHKTTLGIFEILKLKL